MIRPVRTFAFWFTVSSSALAAPVSFTVDVPLTQGKAAADAFLQARGGAVTGGTFTNQGWTTTARSDFMYFALPPNIDARRGKLTTGFSGPELSGPKGYFESYHLVALRPDAQPFRPAGAGNASLSSLYIAYMETDEVMAQGRGYFNLFVPGCTDWQLCTGEGGSTRGWLNGAGPFTIVQDWTDNIDQISFTPSGGGTKTVDLSATSPSGIISAPQFYVTVNACGGSTHNFCGLWDGPTHGGPLGVTYSRATLELIAECGDTRCSEGIETIQNCAADCGAAGAGGSAGSGGAAGAGSGGASGSSQGGASGVGGVGGEGGTAGSDGGTAGTLGSAGTGGSGARSPSEDGGCGCRTTGADTGAPWHLLTLIHST